MKKFTSIFLLLFLSVIISSSELASDRYHYFDTNIFRIALTGDSILRPVGDDVETDGSHPYLGGKINAVGRMIYDYIDFNKPIWRSIEHTDWTFVGGTQENIAYDGISNTDDIREMAVSDTATIEVTGYESIIFWFEGGYAGESIETGVVKIEVDEGSGYVDPSTTSFQGYRIPTREGKAVVYEDPQDTLNTDISYPKDAYDPPAAKSSYCSHLEMQYNNLDSETNYTFRITVNSDTIRLGGCFYWTGKTAVVTNSSVPGYNWENLQKTIYNRITIFDYQMVICESLIYHDFATLAEIEANAKNFLRQLLRYNTTRVALWSCTPMAGAVEDADPILGSEEPAYVAGQNLGKEFNHRIAYNITLPSWADYPDRNDVYRVTINAVDYDLRVTPAKVGEGDFPTYTYNDAIIFEYPEGYPLGDESYPLTGTRISGSGAASFSFLSVRNTPPSFDVHRNLMRDDVAKYFRIEFSDVYQHFVDLAAAYTDVIPGGETVDTEPYLIEPGSPLYPEFDGGYENYLSRYFNPNHWRAAANQPVANVLINDLFLDFDGR